MFVDNMVKTIQQISAARKEQSRRSASKNFVFDGQTVKNSLNDPHLKIIFTLFHNITNNWYLFRDLTYPR